jgi:hypothetical protein
MVTDAGILVVGFNVLEPVGPGGVTIPQQLGNSPWAVIAGLAVVVAVDLFFIASSSPSRRFPIACLPKGVAIAPAVALHHGRLFQRLLNIGNRRVRESFADLGHQTIPNLLVQ